MNELGPFSVEARQIERLDHTRYTQFVNRLLATETAAHDLRGVVLETTYKDNVPDEGVDAGLRAETDTEWIPGGESAWQFKAGDLPPGKCKSELAGADRALEILRSGGKYRLVLGVSLTSSRVKNRREALQAQARDLGIAVDKDTIEVVTADGLARWTEDYPALALSPLLEGLGHVGQTFEEWSSSNRHTTSWTTSETREQGIAEVRSAIEGADQQDLHIQGVSGTGKTRLVLEAIRGQPYERLTLYAPSADSFPVAVLAQLHRQGRSATVVVDECDAKNHEIFASILTAASSLRLITMGEDTSRSTRSPMIGLRGLEDGAMKQLLEANRPALWIEARDVITNVAAGNVDYALKAARAVVESSALSAGDLVDADDIRAFVTDGLPDGALFLECCVLALLDRVGFDGEVADEVKMLAGTLDLPERTLRNAARTLEEAELLGLQGRYRSVRPYPVAVYLAGRAWNLLGERIVDDLIPAMSAAQVERLLQRAAEVGDAEVTGVAVDRSLSSDGPLGSWESLQEEGNSGIAVHLAVLAPNLMSLHLAGMLKDVPMEELAKAKGVRRDLVWTLEKLAWRSETFETAADVLLQLAQAENEDFVNNATGTWVALFGTMLPATAASPKIRLDYLTEVAKENGRIRRLVVDAARQALTFHESITVSAERQGGVVVEPRGRPSTYAEAWDYMSAMMDVLFGLVHDQAEEVAEEALSALISAIHPTLDVPPLRSHLSGMLAQLDGVELRSVRLELAKLDSLFSRVDVNDGRQEGLAEFVKELPAESSEDRLWEIAHTNSWQARDEDVAGSLVAAASHLAHGDASAKLLGFLAEDDLPTAYEVGRALAVLAGHRGTHLEALSVHLDDSNGSAVVGYLQELNEAGQEHAFDDYIEGLHRDAATELRLTVNGPRTDRARVRAEALSEVVSVHEMARLMFRWLRESDPEDMAVRLTTWSQRVESQVDYNSLLDLVGLYLHGREELPDPMIGAVSELVEQRRDLPSIGPQEWEWSQIARMLLAIDAVAILRLLADMIETDAITAYSGSQEVQLMKAALEVSGGPGWTEVMDRIAAGSWRLGMAADGWLGGSVDLGVAMEWVNGDLERARTLASVSSVGEDRVTPVGTYLIETFGDDEQVSSSLVGEFYSGSWTGSRSGRLSAQIEMVQTWMEDPEQPRAIKRWARKLMASLEAQRDQALLREAERGW